MFERTRAETVYCGLKWSDKDEEGRSWFGIIGGVITGTRENLSIVSTKIGSTEEFLRPLHVQKNNHTEGYMT